MVPKMAQSIIVSKKNSGDVWIDSIFMHLKNIYGIMFCEGHRSRRNV